MDVRPKEVSQLKLANFRLTITVTHLSSQQMKRNKVKEESIGTAKTATAHMCVCPLKLL